MRNNQPVTATDYALRDDQSPISRTAGMQSMEDLLKAADLRVYTSRWLYSAIALGPAFDLMTG